MEEKAIELNGTNRNAMKCNDEWKRKKKNIEHKERFVINLNI
jgi:hypothetical protein